jgi:hypothetical protein
MSEIIETHIQCDICAEDFDGNEGSTNLNVVEQRILAKKEGWTYTARGHDLCKECSEAMKCLDDDLKICNGDCCDSKPCFVFKYGEDNHSSNCGCCGAEMHEENGKFFRYDQMDIPFNERTAQDVVIVRK